MFKERGRICRDMLLKVLFYMIIFIIGTLFGNFATLVIYRLPLNKELTKEKSFCPKCKHELKFIDLIPIWSYIFLKGKCRYCGKKISSMYLVVELVSGITAVLLYLTLQVPSAEINTAIMINWIYLLIYSTTMIIVAAIDKKEKVISRQVILFGTLVVTGYLFYMLVMGNISVNLVYKYSAYIISIILLYAINSRKVDSYIIDLVMIIEYMQLFFTTEDSIITVLLTLVFTIMVIIVKKSNVTDHGNILVDDEKDKLELSVAYYMGISNFIVLCIQIVILYWFKI